MSARTGVFALSAGLVFAWLASPAFAAPPARCAAVAQLVQFEGQVSIKPAGKVVKTSPGKLPHPLCEGDEMYTFEGRARVQDGRYEATLDRFSSLKLRASASDVNGGSVLFDVQKRGAQSGVQVKTRLSVIGVKGTRFLVVDANEAVRVAMDEGEVEVNSTQGPVALYREKPADAGGKSPDQIEYERFVAEREAGVAAEKSAFDAYKAATEREFVAYVENLTLGARRELVTQGNIALERGVDDQTVETMRQLRAWR